jgi:hypothetical protein
MKKITYRAGYKYQLIKSVTFWTNVNPTQSIRTLFIDLDSDGTLTIKCGYSWDGPSGPTIDTKNFMRGSLAHDALYQLMREGHLDEQAHRNTADKLLRKMCRKDGMTAIRAWWVYQAVKRFGKSSATIKREVITAP